jgi:hypothetical protein
MIPRLASAALALLLGACTNPEPRSAMELGTQATVNVPPLAASRRVSEQSCTEPQSDPAANLRCR